MNCTFLTRFSHYSLLAGGIIQATSKSEQDSSPLKWDAWDCSNFIWSALHKSSSWSFRIRSCSSLFCFRHFALLFLNQTWKEKTTSVWNHNVLEMREWVPIFTYCHCWDSLYFIERGISRLKTLLSFHNSVLTFYCTIMLFIRPIMEEIENSQKLETIFGSFG